MVAILVISLVAVGAVVLLAFKPVRFEWFFKNARAKSKTQSVDPYIDEVYDDEEL